MSSPADILYQALLDLGLIESSGRWTGYVSFLPNTPDDAVCVYDTAGRIDARLMLTGEQIVHPGVQVRVRGLSYSAVWEKANEIALAMDGLGRIDVALSSSEAYTLINVSRTGDIVPVGIEEENGRRRHHFTINAVITLEKG